MSERPFNADEPIAFFLTWTAYGTWLPGDDRGWHRWGKGGIQPSDERIQESARSEMKKSAFFLSVDDREIVEETVKRHCEIHEWTLHTVNARSNHVHVVVTASGYDPKTVRDQFKAWCTRKLKPFHPGRERFWTEGGSQRWINHDDDLEAAVLYVGEAQDRKDREEHPGYER
ncbi:transposase [Crateriforma conspicua]|uniref:Transposase IS200-like domain-containing protein n=1 Tax=Crateriforma conspicua TaxID=2527996 RepID=A0A5C6FQT1_9PLAN|nr:transposase [Crateriforma conspicua]TWU64634.1 hypothetical protein V7x_01780 [Crateriforma conspicua]